MGSSATAEGPSFVARALALSRAGEWWEYKLVPIFGIFYATALYLKLPILWLWPAALTLLLALVPGAVFVSLINDLTDKAEDAAAGKRNRMAGRSGGEAAVLVAAPVAAGLVIAIFWRGYPLLLAAYLGAWIAFSLYSLPPFRLKTRGLAGVLADASGAHLFPSLAAALCVFAYSGRSPDPLWLAAVAAWAGAYGLRGILWHQLGDIENDRIAGVSTFVQRRGRTAVLSLVRYATFPVEGAALAALLWQLHQPLPLLFLLLYFLIVRLRVAWWETEAVLVEPRGRYLLFLHDYYEVLLPLSLLIASALQHPLDAFAIAAHVLLFPNRLMMFASEVRLLGRDAVNFVRR